MERTDLWQTGITHGMNGGPINDDNGHVRGVIKGGKRSGGQIFTILQSV